MLKGQSDYPLLVWIGGGAWSYVDKDQEMALARRLAEQGIAVASVGHRLSPAVWRDPALDRGIQHPAHIEDIANAFAWLWKHAPEYSYDRDAIFLGGFSSGAHLAALLCMDGRRLDRVGLSTQNIRGVIPISGTYDIADYHQTFLESEQQQHLAEQHVEAVFGDRPEDFRDASPTTYLDQLSVPMLIIADRDLDRYTRLFEERIREVTFDDTVVVHVHGLGHSALWRDISHEPQSFCRDLIVDFIQTRSQSSRGH